MNIFFDLDGTLTDSREGILNSFKYMLTEFKKPIPVQDLNWVIGPPLAESIAKLLGSEDEEEIQKAVSCYRKKYLEKGIFENKLFPKIPEILEQLSKSNTLFIATTKPTPQAEIVLKHFKIRKYFKSVYGSNLSGTMSDKKILLAHALKEEVLDSKESVMIGDRIFDMEAASACKMPSIAVTWGYGDSSEHLSALKVVNETVELLEVLRYL